MTRAALVAAALAVAVGCTTGATLDPLDPGRDPRVGRSVLSFLWKAVLHDQRAEKAPQELAGPALVGDVVVTGTQGGDLVALELRRGHEKWRTAVGPTSTTPLLDRGRLYVGTDDGQLVAVDAATGKLLWRFASKGAIQHPPVVLGDLLVVSNDADHVYAVDRETGKWRWQYERETPEEFTSRGHAGVATDGERVYAGFSDGHLVALGASTGDVVWVRSLAAGATEFVDVDATPIAADGVVYAASAAGGVYALTPTDGTERWRFEVIGAGDLTLDGDRLYVAAAEAGLHALDLKGRLLWRQGLHDAGDPAAPVVVGDLLYVSLTDAGLAIVDRGSGELVQSWNPGQGISSPPLVSDGRLWTLSNSGVLYAMSVE